ncbi:hypothetical protein [Leptospirillum ferriphilum]|uniref:hypothetical protein n=1 Tax=Leptospirillum ferriphilum TaxID=178606 RepID=UPI000C154BA8|nr:hypothetical protein [Leptospirillum ferriphilum]
MPLKDIRTIVNLLKELPQAKYFWPGAMERWADRVVHRDDSGMPPERLVKRLGGLTGTQTGPIVGAARGEGDPFNETPERLVREKLLIDLPIDQTGDMRRGIGLEPVLKEMYLGKSRSVSHVAALDAIRNYGGSAEHPWLLGTSGRDLRRLHWRENLSPGLQMSLSAPETRGHSFPVSRATPSLPHYREAYRNRSG